MAWVILALVVAGVIAAAVYALRNAGECYCGEWDCGGGCTKRN